MDVCCKLGKKCPNQAEDLLTCWNPDCNGFMHAVGSNLLLDKHSIEGPERPTDQDKDTPESESIVFCKKACHNKWKTDKKQKAKATTAALAAAAKKKRKVPWEDDGSMDVLMDWMTTHGNYASYCGSNGHQNKGKSKSAIHKDIALLIQQKRPASERDAKDVENKIGTLERQFRQAKDWAENTGQGVTDPGDFASAVKNRCPHHCELEDIMGERPNAKPLATNEECVVDILDGGVDAFGEDVAEEVVDEIVAETALEMSNTEPGTPLATIRATTVDPLSSVSSKSVVTKAPVKRLSTVSAGGTSKAKPGKTDVDDVINSHFNDTSYQSMREREVAAREKEATARMLEAQATAEKSRKEMQILDIQAKSELLRERKRLLDEGVCTLDELDELMPLK